MSGVVADVVPAACCLDLGVLVLAGFAGAVFALRTAASIWPLGGRV